MSTVFVDKPSPTTQAPPRVRRIDNKRGTWGMSLFIATETALFLAMFFAYYYTDKISAQWRGEIPPKLHYALAMLAVLLTSSAILYWGEQQVKKQRYGAARIALIATIVLGIGFLVLNYFEDMEHLQHLTPRTDSYGSIFYAITSLHGAHVVFGVLMLAWVLVMPRWEPVLYTPHRPYHNVALYWHFVDTVWVFIVVYRRSDFGLGFPALRWPGSSLDSWMSGSPGQRAWGMRLVPGSLPVSGCEFYWVWSHLDC